MANKKIPVIDGHEDISLNILYATNKDFGKKHSLHEGENNTGLAVNNNVDLPRLKEGGVKIVFASIFSIDHELVQDLAKNRPDNYNFGKVFHLKSGLAGALEQIALYQNLVNIFPNLSHIKSKSDYRKLKDSQTGLLFHLEGIDYIGPSESLLNALETLGVRCLALTWRNSNKLGGGNNSSSGLTPAGKKFVKKLSGKHFVFDLAHSNKKTFWDVLKIVDFPVIVSHTLCDAITPNSRNLDDEQIQAVAKTGGVICLAAIPDYIGGDKISDYVKHFRHVVNLVGINHVGFGTDFDGLVDLDDRFVKDFEDVSKFPNVLNALRKTGLSELDLEKIAYKNLERVILKRLP